MLRRISTLIASAAMVGLCAIPASASTAAAHGSHNFTMPSIKGHYNVVKGWGSYDRLNSVRVKVTACVEQTGGNPYAVAAEAVAYNSSGRSKNIAGFIIQGHKGQVSCGHITFIFYGVHLKVFTFVGGSNGKMLAKSALKKIY